MTSTLKAQIAVEILVNMPKKDFDDAPVWMDSKQASAWAAGWDRALTDVAAWLISKEKEESDAK